jgi:putative ABC transport system ATP-binding protein
VLKQNLRVDNATVRYGPKNSRTHALSDVTLSFAPGDLTLVMGPSGSGKTTLLSLLGCLRTPDEGSVTIEGREVNRLSEGERTRMRRRIGFVFQAFRLFHSLPAIDNVTIAAEISRGKARAARRRASAARRVRSRR